MKSPEDEEWYKPIGKNLTKLFSCCKCCETRNKSGLADQQAKPKSTMGSVTSIKAEITHSSCHEVNRLLVPVTVKKKIQILLILM